MSPVSRRRPSRRSGPGGRRADSGIDAARLRGMPPLDVLTRELRRVQDTDDAFLAEGLGGFVLGLLDVRGPGGDGTSFASFCREVVDDPRAVSSSLGLQSLALLAELGHPDAHSSAAALVDSADPALRDELPKWCDAVGHVHVVEAGSLRTGDGGETVLHVVLDYDVPSAGSRHLLSVAVEHGPQRVHLLDVRARGPQDSIAPIAEQYATSSTAVWQWRTADEIDGLVGDAVRTSWTHGDDDWPVQDVEGKPTPAWAFGVRRLERITGLSMRRPV